MVKRLLVFYNVDGTSHANWVSDYCLTQREHFSAIWWREEVTFGCDDDDDDDDQFGLDQHAELDFYSASSLK